MGATGVRDGEDGNALSKRQRSQLVVDGLPMEIDHQEGGTTRARQHRA